MGCSLGGKPMEETCECYRCSKANEVTKELSLLNTDSVLGTVLGASYTFSHLNITLIL